MREFNIPQGEPEWHQLRSGKPTASMASNLITSYGQPSKSIDEYALQLAAEQYAGKPVDGFSGNKYTDRGKELEDLARKDYEMRKQILTRRVGFCTDNMMQYGCSPDDFVEIDGSVEYKCKIAKEHLKVVLAYHETGATPTEYFAQPQMVMLVTGKKWCDLTFYHPDLPGLIIRQFPDKPFVRALKKQIKEVIIKRNIICDKLNSLH